MVVSYNGSVVKFTKLQMRSFLGMREVPMWLLNNQSIKVNQVRKCPNYFLA
jgi:hypothetical protein